MIWPVLMIRSSLLTISKKGKTWMLIVLHMNTV
uniref:Uncharacterized protein n=1 Tax=Arundo donax TaxID=35708 RepID=A0A0A9FGS8_ARUDO